MEGRRRFNYHLRAEPRLNAVVSGRSGATTGSRPSNSWDDTAFRTNSIPKDTSTQDKRPDTNAMLQYPGTAISRSKIVYELRSAFGRPPSDDGQVKSQIQ